MVKYEWGIQNVVTSEKLNERNDMKIKIITSSDLPDPGSALTFRIKNTTKFRPGYSDKVGTDFIEEVRGITYRYSWNQIDEYIVAVAKVEGQEN